MGEAVAGFFAGLVVSFLALALQSYLVMLAVGALHSEVSAVPAISYTAAIWLTVAAYVLVAPAAATAPKRA
ncbi:hypothetical protein ACWGA9_06200 [Streptomyces sp. NPDC054950]